MVRHETRGRARPTWCLAAGLLAAAAALLAGCAGGPGAAGGPYPGFAEYAGMEVQNVVFAGDLQLPEDSLRAVIGTRATRCRFLGIIPFCPFGLGREVYELDLEELARDVVRIQLYYRDHGYYGTRVAPSVEETGEEGVEVRIAIAPGDQVFLRELELEGVDTILDLESLRSSLPLTEGEPFRRIGFLRSADTIRTALLREGYAYADVLRNYSLDTIADVAEAQFVAIPGPRVYVDSIRIAGNERLENETLRQQLTLREDQLLRVPELQNSQRNLYALEMVEFASVRIAPDSVEVSPDSAEADVLVQVAEAAQYAVSATAGFGTVDCIRSSASWLNRNFLGEGRRLEVTGSLSRIGAAEPLDAGLSGGVCKDPGLATDDPLLDPDAELESLARKLNYRIETNFQQPRFFNTRTQLGLQLHAERTTELESFVRESYGVQLALSRRIGPQTLVSVTADVENGRTLATPFVLCVGFETCNQQDLEVLRQRRWSNFLSVSTGRDATRTTAGATRGYTLRGSVDWAASALGSDNEYLRTLVEGAYFLPLRPGWVLASNLRYGRFFQGSLTPEDGYIPPERRFYAGGANSVRGFARNTLGPTVYVIRADPEDPEAEPDTISSATGGTEMIVGTLELRLPSPFMSDLFRLAAFVDAGRVSATTVEREFSGEFRITPGVGLRVLTPVGPFRLDVAYSPNPQGPGPLLAVGEDGLVVVDPDFEPDPPSSLLDKFQFHIAFGQAF